MTVDNWDSREYATHSSNQKRWGMELINKLAPLSGEQVLDIGCGDGRLTALIAERTLGGLAVGLDSSPEMITHASQVCSHSHFANLCFVLGDASSIPFLNRFDAAFSNAALHWVLDQRPVLQGVARALRPGGRLLFQMGGKGNASAVIQSIDQLIAMNRWAPFFTGFHFPYGFFSPAEYRKWLDQAGLVTLRAELVPKDATFGAIDQFSAWIRTTWLRYLSRLPSHHRETFIESLTETYLRLVPPSPDGTITVKMVRLEVEARRPL
jgi:trans-aconitate methyltransferase